MCKVLRQCLHHLRCPQHTQMPVWQERENSTPLSRRMVQHDRPRLRNSARGSGDNSLRLLNLIVRQVVIHSPVAASYHPFLWQPLRSNKNPETAPRNLCGNRSDQSIRRTLRHVGIVLAQPLNQKRDALPGTQLALPAIRPRERCVRARGGTAGRRGANPVQHRRT